MIKGLYTSAMGMLMQEAALTTTTNNLANVNTLSYKRDKITYEEFPNVLEMRINDTKLSPGQKFYDAPQIGRLGTGVIVDRITTDHEEGSIRETNIRTNFALEGKAYLMIQGENGVRFTRNGELLVTDDGFLETKNGEKVLGTQSNILPGAPIYEPGATLPSYIEPIRINDDINFEVNNFGMIRGSNFRFLKVVFENTNSLQKEGYNNFKLTEGQALKDDTFEIRQGFLEYSNVNVVSEMVNMIKVQRAYEANSKILQGIDDAIGQTASQLGRLR